MTGNSPHSSALLDIDVSGMNPKGGLLIPRMTTAERDVITSPALSLLIFNTTTGCFEFWDGDEWISLIPCVDGCTPPSTPTANDASGVSTTAFTANWGTLSGATMYYLDVATDNAFTNFVSGYNNLNVGDVTSYNVTGLTCNTTYYYRVRAGNNCGRSSNSNVISVTTSGCGPSCGTQVWMTANINVGTRVNGSQEQNNDGQPEKYCYNDNESNCTTYGGLYQWAEALGTVYSNNSASYTGSWATCDPCGSGGIQGLCPNGYHVPTDLEWSRYEWCVENNISPAGGTSLSSFQTTISWRGSTSNTAGVGAKLKASSSNTPSWDGTNASGFTALPAGYRNSGGGFYSLGTGAYFWSATEYNALIAWYRYLGTDNWQSYRYYTSKTTGFSLRCIQN